MSFYEKYIDLCREHGKYPTVVAEELGLSKGAVSKWRHGSTPNDVTLAAIAAYFGCQIDDLRGGDNKALSALKTFIRDESGSPLVFWTPKQKTVKAELINRITDMDEAAAARALEILKAAGLL